MISTYFIVVNLSEDNRIIYDFVFASFMSSSLCGHAAHDIQTYADNSISCHIFILVRHVFHQFEVVNEFFEVSVRNRQSDINYINTCCTACNPG